MLAACYQFMLRFYPPSLREEFGAEMRWVFVQRVAEARQAGARSAFAVFLRELMDWPAALVRAHRVALRSSRRPLSAERMEGSWLGGQRGMRRMAMACGEWVAVSRRRALARALSPMVLGLGIMTSALIRTDVWYRLPPWQLYLSAGVVLSAGAVVGVIGLLALVRGIPAWGVTWLGAAMMGFTLLIKVLTEEGVEEGWLRLSPPVELALALAFLGAGGALLLVLARRGWTVAGAFTLAAAATFGLSLMQAVTAAPISRTDVALLAAPLGLAFAALIFAYVLSGTQGRVAVVVATALLNAGVVVLASSAWEPALGQRGAAPLLPLLVLLTGVLLAGPVSGLVLRPLVRS